MFLFILGLLRVLRSSLQCYPSPSCLLSQAFQPCPEQSEGEDLAEMGSVCIWSGFCDQSQ